MCHSSFYLHHCIFRERCSWQLCKWKDAVVQLKDAADKTSTSTTGCWVLLLQHSYLFCFNSCSARDNSVSVVLSFVSRSPANTPFIFRSVYSPLCICILLLGSRIRKRPGQTFEFLYSFTLKLISVHVEFCQLNYTPWLEHLSPLFPSSLILTFAILLRGTMQ